MSLINNLPQAKINLKNDLLSFFNSNNIPKTTEEASEQLAEIIMDNVYNYIITAKVKIPSLTANVSVPNVEPGSATRNGSGSTLASDTGELE
jgi:hypothetical protein